MGDKIKLTSEQISFLSALPEQGMGYQIVDITLKNGLKLKKRIVLNGSYLQINKNEKLDIFEIKKIELHK